MTKVRKKEKEKWKKRTKGRREGQEEEEEEKGERERKQKGGPGPGLWGRTDPPGDPYCNGRDSTAKVKKKKKKECVSGKGKKKVIWAVDPPLGVAWRPQVFLRWER